MADPDVLRCHQDVWASLYHGELGASAAMLRAGYNLGSLLLKYQGVDWRLGGNWACNGRWALRW